MNERQTYAQLKAGKADLEVLYGYVDNKGRVFSSMGLMSEDHLATVFNEPGHKQGSVRTTWRYVPAFDICFWWSAPSPYDKEMTETHIKKKFPGTKVINRMIGSELSDVSRTLSNVLSHGPTHNSMAGKLPTFKQYWMYKHGGD